MGLIIFSGGFTFYRVTVGAFATKNFLYIWEVWGFKQALRNGGGGGGRVGRKGGKFRRNLNLPWKTLGIHGKDLKGGEGG